MLGPDLLARVVEVDLVPALEVDAADREPDLGTVEPLEIHEALQSAPQGSVVVDRDVVRHPGQDRPQPRIAALEDVGPAEQQGHDRVHAVVGLPQGLVPAQCCTGVLRRLGPELPKLLEPLLGRVAGQDRTCDRAHRRADDPVGADILPVEVLIGTGQVGAEGVAAAQHESRLGGATHKAPVLVPWCS